jgi:hypothetical protein
MRVGLHALVDVEAEPESVRDVHHRAQRDERVVGEPGGADQDREKREREQRHERLWQGGRA